MTFPLPKNDGNGRLKPDTTNARVSICEHRSPMKYPGRRPWRDRGRDNWGLRGSSYLASPRLVGIQPAANMLELMIDGGGPRQLRHH
jgi:hypothetical protein